MMSRIAFGFACLTLISLVVASNAQRPGAAQGPSAFPSNDNQWHLGYSITSFESTGVAAEVAATQMGDQEKHPT